MCCFAPFLAATTDMISFVNEAQFTYKLRLYTSDKKIATSDLLSGRKPSLADSNDLVKRYLFR